MLKIVIVEDNPIIRKSLVTRYDWTGMGYEVVSSFEDGAELIDYIESGYSVDVVFTDIMLCQVSGVDIAKYIFEHRINIRVVFLSAHQEFSYAKSGIQYNVYAYLTKPVNTEELRQVFVGLADQLKQVSNQSERYGINKEYDKNGTKLITKCNDELIINAEKYMNQHFGEKLRVEDVARHVNLSPRQFLRRFQKETGILFGDYLLKLRMESTVKLLREGNIDLYEACEMAGYKDVKYFKKIFKKYYGYSVKDFWDNTTGE